MSTHHVYVDTKNGKQALPLAGTRIEKINEGKDKEGVIQYSYKAHFGDYSWSGWLEPTIRETVPLPDGCELWVTLRCQADDDFEEEVQFERSDASHQIVEVGLFTGEPWGIVAVINSSWELADSKEHNLLIDAKNQRVMVLDSHGVPLPGLGWDNDVCRAINEIARGADVDVKNLGLILNCELPQSKSA